MHAQKYDKCRCLRLDSVKDRYRRLSSSLVRKIIDVYLSSTLYGTTTPSLY